MERAFKQYVDEITSEIAALVYSDGEGAMYEDKFTEYCLEILDSIGKTEGARVLSYVHPNSSGGIDWKINGYCFRDSFKDDNGKEYFETLDLFVSFYKINDYNYNILKSDFEKTTNQIKRFINAALKKHIDYIDSSKEELVEVIKIIEKSSELIDRINVYFLVNGSCGHNNPTIKINGYENLLINSHIWDIQRLFRINESNSLREPIEIKLSNYLENKIGLEALEVELENDDYECFLVVVQGSLLADLYKEFSSELLESNVRAFLGQAGKFNKGIRDTIRSNPQMFLPYNNGITATANKVIKQTKDNKLYITELNDFQIVNGGQTTASLFHTRKKFSKEVDLTKIFVQMKLTVIKDSEIKNMEVPNIARFANSQNKVSELDLSSNNPFFIEIEGLSRKKYVTNPENPNSSLLWFFERVKGQYREKINNLTPSNQRKFKEQNPTKFKFIKSDIAKFINIWEQKPFMVARGAQKNFIDYTKSINILIEKNKLPGINYYKKLIGNAIVFKSTDKMFGRKNVDAIGDTNLKSFTVAYSIAYFHYLSDGRLDLWKIYNNQKLENSMLSVLKEILINVYDFLTSNSPGLVSEFAKKETTWKKLKETDFKVQIPEDVLTSKETNEIREEEEEQKIENKEDDRLFYISYINKLGMNFWDGLKIYLKENPTKTDLKYESVFDLLNRLKKRKRLVARDITIAKKVENIISNNSKFEDDVKSKSKIVVKETVDIKQVYDKLLQIDNDTWKRIIALGEQTKVFEYKELSNIKTVYSKIKSKGSLSEFSILKCFESLKKVKKFGIKVV